MIGWREWLALPDLEIDRIKVKVDTGARTSALHALDVERFEREGLPWVRFSVYPIQRNVDMVRATEAPMLEERWVRSSSGKRTRRPVIVTTLVLGDHRWPAEITLVRRDLMGFRMLLGRQAVRRRFWVEPGASYRFGR